MSSLTHLPQKWPKSRCVLAYPRTVLDPEQNRSVTQWEERNIAVHGLLASKLPSLGASNPISRCTFSCPVYLSVRSFQVFDTFISIGFIMCVMCFGENYSICGRVFLPLLYPSYWEQRCKTTTGMWCWR